MSSSLQDAVNKYSCSKRSRDAEYEPLQSMVKRLRVDDSSPNPEEQMRYQQPLVHLQNHTSYQPPQCQRNPQIQDHHQQPQASKYITRIQYHSNLGGETVSSENFTTTIQEKSYTGQTAGEDTCSRGSSGSSTHDEMVFPMNRLLGSLHQQRRIQKMKTIP
mmetsp:Transcript_1388/g.1853  ORF Transcript_1388/g.1853 Transcript_1388/m.1853 type:complete len:161 (-) Transcript_1388:155-637(-)|eukprot:CAMPEP_0178936622 /NCGR_PEP_ID=MMETSP0786-20121207/25285_1 /TAXON_ID=186022 /ORGANISM="Thalassionema frauenfeldii, Strain CCMP 1798" /LENGTH=160 /DNA_ID=CAMNT_0020615065 /DNA_START=165 /DNA_END=647 /DNA_ORIENTATION=-